MPRTETLMDAGPWSLPLVPNLPRSIRNAIRIQETEANAFGHLIVHRGYANPATISGSNTLTELVKYIGVYRRFEDDTMMGLGPEFWLGVDGYGQHTTATSMVGLDFTGATLIALDDFISTVTVVGAGPGGTIDWEWGVPPPNTRELIDHVCQYFGAEWRMTSPSVLEVGLAADLYPGDPTVMFSADGGGDDPTIKALTGRFRRVDSVENWYSQAIVSAGGSFPASATRTTTEYRSWLSNLMDGTGGVTWERVLDDTSVTAPDLATQAQRYIDLDGLTEHTYQVETDHPDPVGVAGGVGRDVFVYDLKNELYGANEGRYFRGVWTLPYRMRIASATTPWRRGDGYIWRHRPLGASTSQYVDLTPYIDWDREPQVATLDLGVHLAAASWLRDRRRFGWQG
jgi:hypothetical protein